VLQPSYSFTLPAVNALCPDSCGKGVPLSQMDTPGAAGMPREDVGRRRSRAVLALPPSPRNHWWAARLVRAAALWRDTPGGSPVGSYRARRPARPGSGTAKRQRP
jgi:hypothetical protein